MTEHLPKDISHLLALPSPNDSHFNKARRTTISRAAQEFLSAWKMMPQEYDQLCKRSASYICPGCGAKHKLAGKELWCRKFFILGTYYDYLMHRLITQKATSKNHDLPPGLNLHSYSQFLEQFPRKTKSAEPAVGHMLIASYLSCLIPSYFTGLFRNCQAPHLPLSVFEEQAHSGICRLHEYSFSAPHRDLRRCSQILTQGLLRSLKNAYSSKEVVWNKDHRAGPFSALQIQELAPLAARDTKLLNRYGRKHVEKVFERQLALLFQSYGFYVVATKVGQRTVDLICISSDPREPMTIMVEAKTSARPYSLPTKDRRALVEYVQDVKKTLTTLPPLAFVLVTGPEPSPSLEGRLNELEAEIGVPARFATAAELASIRECMVGPLPLETFRKDVLVSDTRILTNLGESIQETHELRQQAHSDLVKTMLGGVPGNISTLCPEKVQSKHNRKDECTGK